MKAIRYTSWLILFLLLLPLAGCQNDGPIGYKFGVWRVDSYTVDNQPVEDPLVYQTTIAFQGGVVNVIALNDDYIGSNDQYGSWSEDGDRLYLDFTHGDDNHPAGSDYYAAPWWLGWTSDYVMEFTVEKHSDREMTWKYINPQGETNIYKLHKTW